MTMIEWTRSPLWHQRRAASMRVGLEWTGSLEDAVAEATRCRDALLEAQTAFDRARALMIRAGARNDPYDTAEARRMDSAQVELEMIERIVREMRERAAEADQERGYLESVLGPDANAIGGRSA